jgi:hypothetical protein
MIESLTNELSLTYSALTGSPFQHLIVALFEIHLLPDHGAGFHTSQYTSSKGELSTN